MFVMQQLVLDFIDWQVLDAIELDHLVDILFFRGRELDINDFVILLQKSQEHLQGRVIDQIVSDVKSLHVHLLMG